MSLSNYTKRAVLGGLISLSIIGLGTYMLGSLSGYEAKELIKSRNNSQSTLWSSWVITSENENIYFSGDSGYAPHFKEIGEKYGPFNLALMECGQYNLMWPDIHMMPEETAQAGIDVRANKIMPIHWAGFKLALHDWKDPIVRVKAKADELNIEVITPQIGQEIIIKDSVTTYLNWWKDL